MDDGTRTHDDRDHNPGLYQLSYAHHRCFGALRLPSNRDPGTPGRTRTCNRRLRRPMLYPVELRARCPDPLCKNGTTVVGAERFELPTLCSQSRCATRLRHAPVTDACTLLRRALCARERSSVNDAGTDQWSALLCSAALDKLWSRFPCLHAAHLRH